MPHLEGNLLAGIHEYSKLPLAYNQVILSEFVVNVPSYRSKAPAFLWVKEFITFIISQIHKA